MKKDDLAALAARAGMVRQGPHYNGVNMTQLAAFADAIAERERTLMARVYEEWQEWRKQYDPR